MNHPCMDLLSRCSNDFSIHYSAASENIAGNQTIEAAHNSLMNSPSHKENILSSGYNYMGIGIMDDPRYGKIFVQMYIQTRKEATPRLP